MLPIWKHYGAKVSTSNSDDSIADASPDVRTEITAGAVLDRMKEVAGLRSDSELAERLKTSRSTVSKWRNRNAIPYAEAVFLALAQNSSLDYILTGNQPDSNVTKIKAIEQEFIRAALLNLYEMQIFKTREDRDPLDEIRLVAQGIAHQYERAQTMKRKLIEQEGLSEHDAQKAALTGLELLSSAGDIFEKRYAPHKKGL